MNFITKNTINILFILCRKMRDLQYYKEILLCRDLLRCFVHATLTIQFLAL